MRRIILFFLLLLPLAAPAREPAGGKAVPKAKITAAISEFRRYEGVEVVRLGRVGTAAVKTLMRAAAQDDPDAREALQSATWPSSTTKAARRPCARRSSGAWTRPWTAANC